jgi:hypothetical protein
MAAPLVSITLLRRELRMEEDWTVEDALLLSKLTQAQDIILDYIARPSDTAWTATIAAWTAGTMPARVQAAILLQAVELYRFRGDDEKPPDRDVGDLSPAIKALLRRTRRPVFA